MEEDKNKHQPSDQESNGSNPQKPKKEFFKCLKDGNDDYYCKSWYLKK